MNRKIAMLLAGAGLLSGMTAVFAQSMDGFDPDAIEARADQFREDAQALFEYATTNAETHTEEAQAVVQQGQQSIEGLDVSQIAGGQGPFDFDEMVAGAKAGMAKPEGAPLFNRKLRRAEVLRFFEKLPPCLVGMEACASAQEASP